MNIITFFISIGFLLTVIGLLSPNVCYFIHKKHFNWVEKDNSNLKRANYLYTIKRNGEFKTIFDYWSHPLMFLAIEKELGNDTYILLSKELTDAEFNYYHQTKK